MLVDRIQFMRGHIWQINVTNLSSFVRLPCEHCIDSFGKLGAATLVDTAGVNPYVFKPTLQSLSAAAINLWTCAWRSNNKIELSKCDFIFTPGVGKNGVFRNSLLEEFLQLPRPDVQETRYILQKGLARKSWRSQKVKAALGEYRNSRRRTTGQLTKEMFDPRRQW